MISRHAVATVTRKQKSLVNNFVSLINFGLTESRIKPLSQILV